MKYPFWTKSQNLYLLDMLLLDLAKLYEFSNANKLIIYCYCVLFTVLVCMKEFNLMQNKKQNLSQSAHNRNYYCAGNVFSSDVGFPPTVWVCAVWQTVKTEVNG